MAGGGNPVAERCGVAPLHRVYGLRLTRRELRPLPETGGTPRNKSTGKREQSNRAPNKDFDYLFASPELPFVSPLSPSLPAYIFVFLIAWGTFRNRPGNWKESRN